MGDLETAASSGYLFCTFLTRFLNVFRKLSPDFDPDSHSVRVWKYARIDTTDTLGKLTTLGGIMKLASLPGNGLELWRLFLFREILSFSIQRILLASLK
jgi:hypothetical protein